MTRGRGSGDRRFSSWALSTWILSAWPVVALSVALSAAGCNRSEVRDWSVDDHDGAPAEAAQSPGVHAQPVPVEAPREGEHGPSAVVMSAWKQNCMTCHGIIGRGDGPQGAALRPPDLTDPAWQRSVDDERIRQTLKSGRGSMPAFGHLPSETIDGLVELVRMLSSDRGASSSSRPPAAPLPSEGGAALPPSHPPIGSSDALPPGHPTLPPGHPPLPAGHPPLPADHPPVSGNQAAQPGSALPPGHP